LQDQQQGEQIPIRSVLTSASLNDTQAAVPLSLLTAQSVTSLYDLMDAGYDADQIREQSVSLGHIPIIPRRKLGSEPAPVMDPPSAGAFLRAHRSGTRLLAVER
jgi:hypothetical protein